MSYEFEPLGLRAGIWSGRLRAEAAPARVVIVHMGTPVGLARLIEEEEDGCWRVDAALPAEQISEGVQSFSLLADQGGDGDDIQPGAIRLAHLSLVAGEPLAEDLRAEIELLRAEVDLLKREFRRLTDL